MPRLPPLFSLAVLSCRADHVPTVSLGAGSSAASTALAAATTASRVPGPPSAPACEGLWTDYHALVPESPYVDHDGFVARCARSEPAVLSCVVRTSADIQAMLDRFADPDAGPEPSADRFVAFAMATRIGVCLTGERLRFALRTGELDGLVRDLASDARAEGPFGTRVVTGTYATLPWRGVHEHKRTAESAPPGEIRVARKPDGRVWIYFLGALLGRHQNQIGFLYSSAPFLPADFKSEADPENPGRAEVCLGTSPRRDQPTDLYMHDCFGVVERIAPQLIQVGATPD
jgi:hypothetical protein